MRARLTLATLLAAFATAEAADRHAVERVETRLSADEGQYLIDGRGRTLYRFTGDARGERGAEAESNCRDGEDRAIGERRHSREIGGSSGRGCSRRSRGRGGPAL